MKYYIATTTATGHKMDKQIWNMLNGTTEHRNIWLKYNSIYMKLNRLIYAVTSQDSSYPEQK